MGRERFGRGIYGVRMIWLALSMLSSRRYNVVDGYEAGGRDNLDVPTWTSQPFLEFKLRIVRYLLFSQRKYGILVLETNRTER